MLRVDLSSQWGNSHRRYSPIGVILSLTLYARDSHFSYQTAPLIIMNFKKTGSSDVSRSLSMSGTSNCYLNTDPAICRHDSLG